MIFISPLVWGAAVLCCLQRDVVVVAFLRFLEFSAIVGRLRVDGDFRNFFQILRE
jgi:hypothetical protein